jgi:hypothetical protein
MSEPALKLVLPPDDAAPAAQQPGRFITFHEAAERSGLNVGSIRRRCLEEWQHNGLAKKGTMPSGQEGWMVDESADPRFAAVKNAEQKDAIFDPAKLGLSDAQTQEVLRRRKIVADWNDAVRASAAIGLTERQVTDQYLARMGAAGTAVSRATLYNWLAAWRKDGVNGLIDSRWKGQRTGDDYSDFMALLTTLFLDRGRRKPLTVCYGIAESKAQENGWTVPSYGTAHRLIKRLDPAVVARYRHGDKRFTDNHEPNLHRDYSSIASNDWWCSDDTPIDVFVVAGAKPDGKPNYVRPILHAWQDLRSRKILAWELRVEAATAPVVLRTFVTACEIFGVPKVAYVDNGKTFDSAALQGRTKKQRQRGEVARECEGAFNVLGVETIHAWPFHGQSKPIERFFNTLEARFAKTWDTYTGKDTTQKPDWMHRADSRASTLANAPTLAEFTAALGEWIDADYNRRVHLGDAMNDRTPDQCFAEELKTKRTLGREQLEFATFQRIGPVKIGQDGVRYKGLHFGQFDQQLARRHGQQVKLAVDDRDLSHVYVCDLEGRFICRAKANGKIAFVRPGDVTDATLREAISEKKRLRKSLKQYTNDRPRMSLDVPDLAIAAARKKAELLAQPAAPAVPIQPVRTPFDDQFSAIQQAMPGSSFAQQRAAELAALDEFRPTHMKLADAEPAEDDLEVFDTIAAAMREKRQEASA